MNKIIVTKSTIAGELSDVLDFDMDLRAFIKAMEESVGRPISKDEDLGELLDDNWKGFLKSLQSSDNPGDAVGWLFIISGPVRYFDSIVRDCLLNKTTDEELLAILNLDIPLWTKGDVARAAVKNIKSSEVHLKVINSDLHLVWAPDWAQYATNMFKYCEPSKEVTEVTFNKINEVFLSKWEEVSKGMEDYDMTNVGESIEPLVDAYNKYLDKKGFDLPKLNFEEFPVSKFMIASVLDQEQQSGDFKPTNLFE